MTPAKPLHRAKFYLGWLLLLLTASVLDADERIDRLSTVHKDWIQKEVVYIITEQERDVFLSLESVDERARFIEAFWRKRDPNPATPENEFKIEHYRRIDYANTYLGRDTFREGWQTDRGRFYIILGEPRDIQRFDGYAEIVGSHLWFYQGDPRMGTPSFFYLLFFKKNDFGEFRLYHPTIDGPQALLTGDLGVPSSDNRAAIQALREVSGELAVASLSFDTSESADIVGGRASIGNDIMIARIEESPKRAIRTDYADAWMRYGNRVSADYSFNFVPSRNDFSLLAMPSGASLVHFSIEIDPENFSVETDDDKSKFYTTLDISIEARTEDGVLVVATDKEAVIEMTPSQMNELQSLAFAYQDDFLLVPGMHTVSVILRNRVMHQYTVAEKTLEVPELSSSEPSLVDVILAFDSEMRAQPAAPGKVSTYQLGRTRFQPATDGLFVIGDTVHVITQAYGASTDHEVSIELLDASGTVLKSIRAAVGADGLVVDHLKLDSMVGGSYEVVGRLLSPTGQLLSSRRTPLVVSPRSSAARPGFVYRRGLNTSIPGLVDFMRGEQFWNLGMLDRATQSFEAAVGSGNDRLVPARWKLANAYLRQQRPDDALALLQPLEEAFGEQFEVIAGLGFTKYMKGDFSGAVSYLTRARGLSPPDAMLLNALADSHEQTGDPEAAREAYARSLELVPEQPAVKQRLASLDGR